YQNLRDELAEKDKQFRADFKSPLDNVLAKAADIGGRLLGVEGLIPETKALAKEAGTEAKAASKAAEKTESVVTLVKDTVNMKLADLDKELEKLEEATREKLASVTAETQDRLRAAVADREKFEKILMEEAKLSADQVEKLKGFTTEQILALIGSAGAAAAAGVAGGRGGKSRSQPEIDALKKELASLTSDVMLHRAPPKE
ncbi:MAG: hypothetical protein ACREDG_08485, partial [Methylocella sp.]